VCVCVCLFVCLFVCVCVFVCFCVFVLFYFTSESLSTLIQIVIKQTMVILDWWIVPFKLGSVLK